MANVIIASNPVAGHVTPMLAIAGDLVVRGHAVTVYTGAGFAERALATGAGFRALPPEADYLDVAGRFPERATIPAGPARVAFDIKNIGLASVPAQLSGLRALLDEFPADVIISEHTLYWPLALALGTPAGQRPVLVTAGIFGPLFHSEDAPPAGPGLLPLPGEEGRARHRAMNAAAKHHFQEIQTYAVETFATFGVRLDEFLFDAMLRHADHYLQLTVPGFEYPRDDIPATFRYAGPVLPALDDAAFEPPGWWAELDGDRPVVVVTQGTVANDDLGALVVPALRALAGLDVLVVAATARQDGPHEVRRSLGAVPENARLAGFVPFDRLLPRADVLVTNGGYGGVHVALRHGVPMVVAGDTEDKPEVAARVQWSGAGVNLRSGNPAEADIRAAVQAVLDDSGFASAARALRDEFGRYRAFDAIAGIVSAGAA